jgi:hypothetical protein
LARHAPGSPSSHQGQRTSTTLVAENPSMLRPSSISLSILYRSQPARAASASAVRAAKGWCHACEQVLQPHDGTRRILCALVGPTEHECVLRAPLSMEGAALLDSHGATLCDQGGPRLRGEPASVVRIGCNEVALCHHVQLDRPDHPGPTPKLARKVRAHCCMARLRRPMRPAEVVQETGGSELDVPTLLEQQLRTLAEVH